MRGFWSASFDITDAKSMSKLLRISFTNIKLSFTPELSKFINAESGRRKIYARLRIRKRVYKKYVVSLTLDYAHLSYARNRF